MPHCRFPFRFAAFKQRQLSSDPFGTWVSKIKDPMSVDGVFGFLYRKKERKRLSFLDCHEGLTRQWEGSQSGVCVVGVRRVCECLI